MARHSIAVINGPNLNLLGKREPEIYGSDTLDDAMRFCTEIAQGLGLTIRSFQSNHEGELIDLVHRARTEDDAIIINPGAYSHTSIALHDALQAFPGPIIEVHVSNIHAREPFRHQSYTARVVNGSVIGCGIEGYGLAVRRLATLLAQRA